MAVEIVFPIERLATILTGIMDTVVVLDLLVSSQVLCSTETGIAQSTHVFGIHGDVDAVKPYR